MRCLDEGVLHLLLLLRAVDGEEVPGQVVVSTEKLARGMTNDLILPVQYFVLDAILDVFCRYGEHEHFSESGGASCMQLRLRTRPTCMRR